VIRSPSITSDSGNSTDEERAIRDDFVHPNSLKAWKQKKDKENEEAEQQQQQQAAKAKRPTSGNKSAAHKSPRGTTAADKTAKATSPRDKSPKGAKNEKRQASAAVGEKSPVSKFDRVPRKSIGDLICAHSREHKGRKMQAKQKNK
jgi:hypothetical protein